MGFAHEVPFPQGTRPFEEGGRADRFWIIRTGTIQLDTHAPGRRAAVIETLRHDELVGSLTLTHAAMDARRLGAGLHLPLDWLADAAPDYLDDDEYHTLDGNWLTQALAYVTTPCNGISGILTLSPPAPPNGPPRTRPS